MKIDNIDANEATNQLSRRCFRSKTENYAYIALHFRWSLQTTRYIHRVFTSSGMKVIHHFCEAIENLLLGLRPITKYTRGRGLLPFDVSSCGGEMANLGARNWVQLLMYFEKFIQYLLTMEIIVDNPIWG